MSFEESASSLFNSLVGRFRACERATSASTGASPRPLLITLPSVFEPKGPTSIYVGSEFLVADAFLPALRAVNEMLNQWDGQSNVATPRSFKEFIAYRNVVFDHLVTRSALCEPWGTFETRTYEGMIDIAVHLDEIAMTVCSHSFADEPLAYRAFTLDAVTAEAFDHYKIVSLHRIESEPVPSLFEQPRVPA